MKPKTGIKLLVEAFLILELFTFSLAFNIQINQSFDLSYGFGTPAILAYLGIPSGIFFDQNMAFRVSGYMTKDLYLFGDLGEQSVDSLVLHYIPVDLYLGTVQVKGSGFSPIAVIGVSSKNISLGKVRGTLKHVVFVVKDPTESFLLGPVAYQSVHVYVNGSLVPSNQCRINYNDGEIFVSNLLYGDIVTIEYQSMNESSPYYVLAVTKSYKIKNYSLKESVLTVFSTPVNQYFLHSEIVDGDSNGNLSVSGYLNIDSTASLRLEATKKLSLSNFQFSLGAYLVTKGFRWPMGVAQSEDAGLSFFGQNSYGKVGFNSNLNGLSFSLKASKTNLILQVGKDPNLVMKFSNGNSYLGLNFGSGGIQSTQSFQDGPFSLKFHQHFENENNEWGTQISVSTPITFEASINTSSVGWRISKSCGNFKAAVDWEKASKQSHEKIKATLSDMSMFDFSTLSWTTGFQTEQSTSLLYLNANLNSPFGEINLLGSVGGAIHELSLHSLSMNYSNEFEGARYSIGMEYEKNVLKLDANVSKKISNWSVEMGISMGIANSEFGGALKVNVWRDDF